MKNKLFKITSILCIIILTITVTLCVKISKTEYVGDFILRIFNIKFSTIISVIIIILASYICDKICEKNKFKKLNIIKKIIFKILVWICVLSTIIFAIV